MHQRPVLERLKTRILPFHSKQVLPSGLLPASGACLTPQAERARLKWSNVVCAHEPEIVAELSALAHEGYEARTRGEVGGKSGGRGGGKGGGQGGGRGGRRGGGRGGGKGGAFPTPTL